MLSSFRFHHIGIAVKDIAKTAKVYEHGGYTRSVTTHDPVQNVNICWLKRAGMPLIELVEPVGATSPICKILEKSGVTPYHTCYEVDDIEEAIAELRREHYVQVSKPSRATAISGCRVSFMYNKDVGLIEIAESPATITE